MLYRVVVAATDNLQVDAEWPEGVSPQAFEKLVAEAVRREFREYDAVAIEDASALRLRPGG